MNNGTNISEITVEEAKDVIEEWVRKTGGHIRDNYDRVPREWVRPNEWNPNRQDDYMYSHQLEVMRQAGQIAPIIVREVGPDKLEGYGLHPETHYQILDGEHRWKATGDLGWDDISINNLGDVPDTVAMMITVIMNHVRGESDAIELGRVFRALREEAAGNRKKIERISRWMPFHEREVDVLVGLVRKEKMDVPLPTNSGSEKDLWVKFNFKLPKDAADVCTRALEHVVRRANCTMDRAFELLCADYLAGVIDGDHSGNLDSEEYSEVS